MTISPQNAASTPKLRKIVEMKLKTKSNKKKGGPTTVRSNTVIAAEIARVRSQSVSVSKHKQEEQSKSTTRRKSSGKKYRCSHGHVIPRLYEPDTDKEDVIIVEVETPFAVKNRLMNMMGTNKVKVMNPKYNETMYKRLSKEENSKFENRINKRQTIEADRLRKLVIKGELEANEELLKLPVVRVHTTLRKLEALNRKFFELGVPTQKTPDITPVEPFEDDLTGKVFKSYENHIRHKRAFSVSAYSADDDETVKTSSDQYFSIICSDTVLGECDDEDGNMEVIYDEDNETDSVAKESEPEVTTVENENSLKEGSKGSIPVRSAPNDEENLTAKSQIKNQTNSISNLLDERTFSTESLQNIVRDFNATISADEKTLKEFSALVRSANHKDPFVKELEKDELNQPEIFQFANKITKFYERKQKAADEKLRKVSVGDHYGR